MPNDKINILYNKFRDTYNLGTEQEFAEKLQDPAKRKAFYDVVSTKYNLGDFETFTSKVQKKSPSGNAPEDGSSDQERALAAEQATEKANNIAEAGHEIDVSFDPEAPVASKDPESKDKPDYQSYLDDLGAPPQSEQAFNEAKKEQRIALREAQQEEKVKQLQEIRKGDYTSSALDIHGRDDKAYAAKQLSRRSPLEKGLNDVVGGEGTMAEYKDRLTAIAKDQDLLGAGMEDVTKRIKASLGENVFDQVEEKVSEYEKIRAEYEKVADTPDGNQYVEKLNELAQEIKAFQQNPLVDELTKMETAYRRNSDMVKQMNRDDRYATVQKMFDVAKSVQEWKDNEATKGELVKDIVGKSVSTFAANIATFMDYVENKEIVNPATGMLIKPGVDQEYTQWDAVEDWLRDFDQDINILMATPTQFARPLITDTAKWKDLEIDFIGGEVVARKDGKVVETPDNLPEDLRDRASSQSNWSSMPYQLGTVGADMAWMLTGAGAIGRGLQTAGLAESLANGIGMTAFTAGQHANAMYQDGLEKFDGDKKKALDYAMRTGLMIGAASAVLGPEKDILRKGSAAAKGMTPAKFVTGLIKKGNEEGMEEGIFEPAIERVNQFLISGEMDAIDMNDNISNYIMGFSVGVLGAAGSQTNDLVNIALRTATKDPAKFANATDNTELIEKVNEIAERAEPLVQDVDEDTAIEITAAVAEVVQEEKKLEALQKTGIESVVETQKEKVKSLGAKIGKLLGIKPKTGIGESPVKEAGTKSMDGGTEADTGDVSTNVDKNVEKSQEPDPIAIAAKIATGQPVEGSALTGDVREELAKQQEPVEADAPKFNVETVEDSIADRFKSGSRISTASFDRAGDPNLRKGSTMSAKYLGGDQDIDQMAMELAEEFGIDEQEATEAIVSFMRDNPSGPSKHIKAKLKSLTEPEMASGEQISTQSEPVVLKSEPTVTGEAAKWAEGKTAEEIKARIQEADSGFDPEMLKLEESDPEGLDQVRVAAGLPPRKQYASNVSQANLNAAKDVASKVQKAFPNMKFNFGRFDSVPKGAKKMGRAGFFDPSTGEFYFDERSVGADTPIHEAAHMWSAIFKERNNPAYTKAVKMAKDSPLWQEVENDPDYANLTDLEKGEEVFVRAVAADGLGRLEAGPLKKAINKLWDTIKQMFVKMGYSPKVNVASMTFNEIVATASQEITRGRPLTQASSLDVAKLLAREPDAKITISESVLNASKDGRMDKLAKWLNKWTTTGRGVGVTFRNYVEQTKNQQQATMAYIELTHRELMEAMKGGSDLLVKNVADVFAGRADLGILPPNIIKPLAKLMDARDQFEQVFINNLIEGGQVIMNEALGLLLDSNYDAQVESEARIDRINEKYDKELSKDSNETATQVRYDEFSIRKKALQLRLIELEEKEAKARLQREFLEKQDIPARTQELQNMLRDLMEAVSGVARTPTEMEKALEKRKRQAKKRIKEIEKRIDAIPQPNLTPTELEIMDQITEMIELGLITDEGVTDVSLRKLIDETRNTELRLEKRMLSQNETVQIKYQEDGNGYIFTLMQRDGGMETVVLSQADAEKVMNALGVANEIYEGKQGHVKVRNPKMLINNPLYHKLRKGKYMTRSYKKHDIEDYAKNLRTHMGEQAYHEAVNFIRNTFGSKKIRSIRKDSSRPDGVVEYKFVNEFGVEQSSTPIENIRRWGKKNGMTEAQITKIEKAPDGEIKFNRQPGKYHNHGVKFNLSPTAVVEIMNQIVSVDDLSQIPSRTKVGQMSVDMGPLRKRKNIPEDIRKIMGEYTDPAVNIYRTLMKGALVSEQTRANQELLAEGLGTTFLESKTPTHSFPITKSSMPHLGDNQTYWTTPEIGEFLNQTVENMHPLMKTATFFSGFTKAMLTVFSPGSQARNFWGMGLNLLATGNWNMKDFASAMDVVTADFTKAQKKGMWMSIPAVATRMATNAYRKQKGTKIDRDQVIRDFHEATSLGLIESAADLGELQDALNMITGADTGGAKRTFKTVTSWFSKGYQANDAIGKVVAYKNELANIKKAYPSMDENAAKIKAAEIVKNTMPTYGRAPELFKMISRTPLVGNFLLFRAEMFRTRWNLYGQAIKEINEGKKTDNKALLETGVKRMAAVTTLNLLNGAIAMGARAMLATTDEEDDAVKEVLPKYRQNNQVILAAQPNDGTIKYFDLSYINPTSDFDRAYLHLTKNGNPFKAAMQSVEGMLDPDIFWREVMETAFNADEYDREIYNMEDTKAKKGLQMAAHVLNPLIPTGLKQANYLVIAAWNDIFGDFVDPETKEYIDSKLRLNDHITKQLNTTDVLLNNTLGAKLITQDVGEMYGWKVRAANGRLEDIKRLDDEDLKKKREEEVFKELKAAEEAAKVLNANLKDAYRSRNKKYNTYQKIKNELRKRD